MSYEEIVRQLDSLRIKFVYIFKVNEINKRKMHTIVR